jgi:hypothetical protein
MRSEQSRQKQEPESNKCFDLTTYWRKCYDFNGVLSLKAACVKTEARRASNLLGTGVYLGVCDYG